MSSARDSKSRVPAMESPTSYRLSSSQTRYFSSKSAFCTLSAIRTESRMRAACAVTDAKPTGSLGGFSSTSSASTSSRAVSGIAAGASPVPSSDRPKSDPDAGSGSGSVTRPMPAPRAASTSRRAGDGSTPAHAKRSGCTGSMRRPRSAWAAVRRAARIPSKSRSRSANGSIAASLLCAARFAALLGLAPEPGEGGLGSGEDTRILGQPHDLEGLLDRGRQPAEGQLPALIQQFLQDFDENRDADRIDDLRLLEVEEQPVHARPQERVGLLRDLIAAGVIDVTVRTENGHGGIRPVHDDFQGLAHSVLYILSILAHDDARAMLTAFDPDVVHQAFDDLDAPSALAAGPQRGCDLGGLETGRIEPVARIRDIDLEVRTPPALLGLDAERELHLAVRRGAVLKGVDAGLDHGHLHLVDLVATHLHPLAERRDLRRGGDLHLRRNRNGQVHLTTLDRRHRFSAIPSQALEGQERTNRRHEKRWNLTRRGGESEGGGLGEK